jgi:hypothetical protein
MHGVPVCYDEAVLENGTTHMMLFLVHEALCLADVFGCCPHLGLAHLLRPVTYYVVQLQRTGKFTVNRGRTSQATWTYVTLETQGAHAFGKQVWCLGGDLGE